MKRRSFIKGSVTTIAGIGLAKCETANSYKRELAMRSTCVTMDGNKVSFYTEAIQKPIKVIHIADTHLYKDDERGLPYHKYSARMAKAYNETIHFQTGKKTNPEEAFAATLEIAREEGADLITLGGDIFSFPSEAAIEWVLEKMENSGIPYIYTAGNHDWHYEGMERSLDTLRNTWIDKRLSPLYQGNNPLMYSHDLKDIRIVAIDNSTYEINTDQLDFFKEQVATGLPIILMVHIPLYAPGKGIYFGCAHPKWGADTDENYQIEKRPKWPKEGHTKTTIDFHREVFSAPNILGVLGGHIHRNSLEVLKGKPQIIADDNASGGYLEIDFMPMTKADKKLIYNY